MRRVSRSDRSHPRGPSSRLGVEPLEDRLTPALTAGTFTQTNLVSDQPGVAALTDPNLVNAWGISLSPTAGAFWVSDNGSDKTTLYSGDVGGKALSVTPLVVNVPGGTPTGQVFNGTSDFVVHSGTAAGPAAFILASESGQIMGWNPGVPAPAPSTNAQPAFTSPTAVYKGLAIGSTAAGNFLYAANFHDNRIDVLDKNFAPATLSGTFTDPTLPAGYAPFNIQDLGGKLYVTYAVQDAAKHDDVAGAGNGVVDVFDTSGNFIRRLTAGGPLNSPWGLALAPAGFGTVGGDLLVGNFGDGWVNAFDPTTGAYKGAFTDASGAPIQIDGLWGLTFGNGVSAGDANTLYFSAGPGGESHGLFGSLKAAAAVQTSSGRLEVIGADAGGGPRVTVVDPATGKPKFDFFAFEPTYTGGVRVASGDIEGNGVQDFVAAAGLGGGPRVTVFNGKTGQPVRSFFAFEPTFTGGVTVAVGDVNGDGFDDIIVGAGIGGAPRVQVFSGKDGSVIQSFFAFDSSLRTGVTVAAGDTTGSGKASVVTGAGPGGGPAVGVFNGATGQPLAAFFAGDPTARGGLNVAAGDFTGTGKAEIAVAPAAGGGTVTVVDASGNKQAAFAAFDPAFTGGIRLAAGDLTGTGRDDLILGSGPGGGPDIRIRDGQGNGVGVNDFFAFNSAFTGGVFVG